MAVIDEVPGLVATIDVAGLDLPEYNDDEEEEEPKPRTSTTFVQAESGANFGIATRFNAAVFPHRHEHIYRLIYLDGKSIAESVLNPTHIAGGQRQVASTVSANLGDRTVVQKFTFAELSIGKI